MKSSETLLVTWIIISEGSAPTVFVSTTDKMLPKAHGVRDTLQRQLPTTKQKSQKQRS